VNHMALDFGHVGTIKLNGVQLQELGAGRLASGDVVTVGEANITFVAL